MKVFAFNTDEWGTLTLTMFKQVKFLCLLLASVCKQFCPANKQTWEEKCKWTNLCASCPACFPDTRPSTCQNQNYNPVLELYNFCERISICDYAWILELTRQQGILSFTSIFQPLSILFCPKKMCETQIRIIMNEYYQWRHWCNIFHYRWSGPDQSSARFPETR